MASKRIPRKVKKALKYVYLLPRRNGNMIQYGGVGIIGNRSKWKRKADWNEKCLLVFDEVDKGFDLRYQVGLHNMLTNLPVMHGVKILAVSHTLIPMLLEDKVYAFKYRIMLSPSTYVALETGYSIKINDYNEREEV
nr:MAG: AAA ATPase domain protein [Bacteriophage sp.]